MSDLAAVESRLKRVEDELEITRLMARYGPAVDSGSSQVAAELWTEDGSYDVGGIATLSGREELEAGFNGPFHQEIIFSGAAHSGGLPYIVIVGDQATAVSHSFTIRKEGETFQIWRLSANRWTFVRTADGWRIASRRNRLLDGSAEAREMLRLSS